MHLSFSQKVPELPLIKALLRVSQKSGRHFFLNNVEFIQQTDKRQACIKALSLYHNAALGLHETLSINICVGLFALTKHIDYCLYRHG
ncbi:hypothetical protein DAI21_22110 [Lelliottia sp. WB101]|nr:hypothetical protein DAI21_22110 [Lelliottia sp. WB101]